MASVTVTTYDGGPEVIGQQVGQTISTFDGAPGPQGPQGEQGVDGADGADGADGQPGPGITAGSGAPSGSSTVGELYIDTATGNLYRLS